MSARRKGRELALQMLYQWDINRQSVGEVLESFWQISGGRPEAALRFARRLVQGTLAHLDEIDVAISEHADHWRLPRMAAVDRNVLRLATYELFYLDTPEKVVIDEALEVTKRFSTPDAVGFVNAVLDAVRLEKNKTGEAR